MSADLGPLCTRDVIMYDRSLSLPSTPRRKVQKEDLPPENQRSGVIGSVSAIFQGVMEESSKPVLFTLPERTSSLKKRRLSLSGGDSLALQLDSSAAAEGVFKDLSLGTSENPILPPRPLFQGLEGTSSEADSKRLRGFISPPRAKVPSQKRDFPLMRSSLKFPFRDPKDYEGVSAEPIARLDLMKLPAEGCCFFSPPADDSCLSLRLLRSGDVKNPVFLRPPTGMSEMQIASLAAPSLVSLKQMVDENYVFADILCKNIPKILFKISREDRALKLFRALEKMSIDLKKHAPKGDDKTLDECAVELFSEVELLKKFTMVFADQLTLAVPDRLTLAVSVDKPLVLKSLASIRNVAIKENIEFLLSQNENGIVFYLLAAFFEKAPFFEILNQALAPSANLGAMFSAVKSSVAYPWIFSLKIHEIESYFMRKNDYDSLIKILRLIFAPKSGLKISDEELNSILYMIYLTIAPFQSLTIFPIENEPLKKLMEEELSKVTSSFPQNTIVFEWLAKIKNLKIAVVGDHIFAPFPSGKEIQGFHVMNPQSVISFDSGRASGVATELFPTVFSPGNGVAMRTFSVEGEKKYEVEDDLRLFKGRKTSTVPPYYSPKDEYRAIQDSLDSSIVDPQKWRVAGQDRYLGYHVHEGRKIPKLTWVMADRGQVKSSYPILFFEERDAFSDALAKRVLPTLQLKTDAGGSPIPLKVTVSPQRKLKEILTVIIDKHKVELDMLGGISLDLLSRKIPMLTALLNKSKTFEVLPSADDKVILKTSFGKCGKSFADIVIETLSELPQDQRSCCMSPDELKVEYRDFAEGEIIFVYPSWDHIFKLAGLI